MAKEKYIKIDPLTGKPEYIGKKDGQAIPGVPDDDDLCLIAFKEVKISKTVDDNAGGKKQALVPGVEFLCEPSDACKKKNQEANEKKKKLKDEIDAEKAVIDAQDKIIDDPKQKAQHGAAKAKKKDAEKKRAAAQEELEKFKRNDCVLKYFVEAGGDDKPEHGRHTFDEIKDKKIQNVVCVCQKVAPEPAKK